jgi:hypothetical protein
MNSVLDRLEDVQLICWMGREIEWSWMVFMVDGCYNDIIFYMMRLKSFDEMIFGLFEDGDPMCLEHLDGYGEVEVGVLDGNIVGFYFAECSIDEVE